jgi:hypothetical protein
MQYVVLHCYYRLQLQRWKGIKCSSAAALSTLQLLCDQNFPHWCQKFMGQNSSKGCGLPQRCCLRRLQGHQEPGMRLCVCPFQHTLALPLLPNLQPVLGAVVNISEIYIVPTNRAHVNLSGSGHTLITGGLGALGSLVAAWLTAHSSSPYTTLLSRSGQGYDVDVQRILSESHYKVLCN